MKNISKILSGLLITFFNISIALPTSAVNKLEQLKSYSFKEEKAKRVQTLKLKEFNCKDQEQSFVPGQLIVKFKENTESGFSNTNNLKLRLQNKILNDFEMEELFPEQNKYKTRLSNERFLKAKELRIKHGLNRIYLLKLKSNQGTSCDEIKDLINRLQKDPNIEYVEPNLLSRELQTINDPLYSTGANHSGLWNLEITKVINAWDYSRGNGVKIAVIDSSADITHPDLSNNIFDSSLNSPFGIAPEFHGTHVCGTISAVGNNNRGIIGVAYESKLIPIGTTGLSSPISDSVYAAVNLGANIINLSFKTIAGYSRTDEIAFNYAYDMGVVSIAAAGNDGTSEINYPAGYLSVIAVASTDRNDYRASFSNHGNWIDIAAPGVNILSLTSASVCINSGCRLVVVDDMTYGYALSNGTSMSAPLVSGVAALLKSYWGKLSADNIYAALVLGANQINTDFNIGSGRVDAYTSVLLASLLRSSYLLDPNQDNVYSDLELTNVATKLENMSSSYSEDYDMNNDGLNNKADEDIIYLFVNLDSNLASRLNAIRVKVSNGGSTTEEPIRDVNPIITSVEVVEDFIPGTITNQGKTIVMFTVESSGNLSGSLYLPSASNLTLGGLPVKAVKGTVGQFIGVIDFTNPNGKVLRSIAGSTASYLTIPISTKNPALSGIPTITSIKNKKGKMTVKGKKLRREGYFVVVYEDGTYQQLDLKSPKANQQASTTSIENVSSEIVFALYSLPGRGSDVYEF